LAAFWDKNYIKAGRAVEYIVVPSRRTGFLTWNDMTFVYTNTRDVDREWEDLFMLHPSEAQKEILLRQLEDAGYTHKLSRTKLAKAGKVVVCQSQKGPGRVLRQQQQPQQEDSPVEVPVELLQQRMVQERYAAWASQHAQKEPQQTPPQEEFLEVKTSDVEIMPHPPRYSDEEAEEAGTWPLKEVLANVASWLLSQQMDEGEVLEAVRYMREQERQEREARVIWWEEEVLAKQTAAMFRQKVQAQMEAWLQQDREEKEAREARQKQQQEEKALEARLKEAQAEAEREREQEQLGQSIKEGEQQQRAGVPQGMLGAALPRNTSSSAAAPAATADAAVTGAAADDATAADAAAAAHDDAAAADTATAAAAPVAVTAPVGTAATPTAPNAPITASTAAHRSSTTYNGWPELILFMPSEPFKKAAGLSKRQQQQQDQETGGQKLPKRQQGLRTSTLLKLRDCGEEVRQRLASGRLSAKRLLTRAMPFDLVERLDSTSFDQVVQKYWSP
jgi:hypothetical protein